MAFKKASKPSKPSAPMNKAQPITPKPSPITPKPSPIAKPSLMEKVSSIPTAAKVALGVGAAAAVAGAGALAYKYFTGKKKRNQTQRLKARIIRKQLKIKNIQLDRKLLKEQLKGVI